MTRFMKYDLVKYVPNHACGDQSHEDCELGIVSGLSVTLDLVLVRFERQIRQVGFANAVGVACNPDDLVLIERKANPEVEQEELLKTVKKGWQDGGLLTREWLLVNCDKIDVHRFIDSRCKLIVFDRACFEFEWNTEDSDPLEIHVTIPNFSMAEMTERRLDIELVQIGEDNSSRQGMLLGFYRNQSSLKKLLEVLAEGQ